MSETPTRPPRQARTPQQRTVAKDAKNAKGAKGDAGAEGEETKGGRFAGKKKLLIIGLVVLLAAGAAAYFLVFAKKGDAAPAKPVPGAVEPLESTSLNLAQNHYLRVGIALQLTAEAASGEGAKGPDGSKAKDLIIATYSGKTVEALNNPKERDKLKKELKEKIIEAYEKEVMDIYFTEFVTQ